MKGQMSIFDYPEYLPAEPSIEDMTLEKAAQILNERCSLTFKLSNFVYDDGCPLYKCTKKKAKFGLSFGRFLCGPYAGRRFLSLDIEKDVGVYMGMGYCDFTIEEAIKHINTFLDTGKFD